MARRTHFVCKIVQSLDSCCKTLNPHSSHSETNASMLIPSVNLSLSSYQGEGGLSRYVSVSTDTVYTVQYISPMLHEKKEVFTVIQDCEKMFLRLLLMKTDKSPT